MQVKADAPPPEVGPVYSAPKEIAGIVMVECRHCAFPNAYGKLRCDRCGESLHSWAELVGIPIGLAVVLLVALLLLKQ